MKKYSRKNKEPLVVFLDTYEVLVDELQTTGTPHNNDLWLRGDDGLILQLPNVLWVISGREKLKWKELDGKWKKADNDNFDEHLFRCLSEDDSVEFLKTAGVSDASLCKGLYELTEGLPLYLDLCVDFYHNNENPRLEDFGKSTNELIERFFTYMDIGMKQKIYILACLERWDKELFFCVTDTFNIEKNILLYSQLMDMSFIDQDKSGCYSIDKVVRDVLFNDCDPEIKIPTLDAAIKYFSEKLRTVKPVSEDGFSCLERLLDYAVKRFSDDMELCDSFQKNIFQNLNLYIDNSEIKNAESIMLPFAKRAEQNKNGILYAEKLFFDSRLNCAMGHYSEKEILLPAEQACD